MKRSFSNERFSFDKNERFSLQWNSERLFVDAAGLICSVSTVESSHFIGKSLMFTTTWSTTLMVFTIISFIRLILRSLSLLERIQIQKLLQCTHLLSFFVLVDKTSSEDRVVSEQDKVTCSVLHSFNRQIHLRKTQGLLKE